MEAEYSALILAVHEAMHLRQLVGDLLGMDIHHVLVSYVI